MLNFNAVLDFDGTLTHFRPRHAYPTCLSILSRIAGGKEGTPIPLTTSRETQYNAISVLLKEERGSLNRQQLDDCMI